MRFKIHGTWRNGDQDYVVIKGDSIKEVREAANSFAIERGWTDLWSEKLKEGES